MTPLRAKYIRDLVIHGRSKHTQEAYTRYVCDLARYYRRSPELISYKEVTGWLYHLIKERQLSASSVDIAVSAVRFLYAVTLGREMLDLMASVWDMKRATARADSEVEAILTPPRQPRGRPMTPLRANTSGTWSFVAAQKTLRKPISGTSVIWHAIIAVPQS